MPRAVCITSIAYTEPHNVRVGRVPFLWGMGCVSECLELGRVSVALCPIDRRMRTSYSLHSMPLAFGLRRNVYR